ncbi:SLAF9 protein, partial [Climacteris rufus]|nr:SLAF9 protein [Climacteris rufus]
SPACAGDTTEVIGTVGSSVTFHIQNPAGSAAMWSFGTDPIATVIFRASPGILFFDGKFRTRFTFPENGRALSISQLSLADAGIYSVKMKGETSTFTLRVYRELAEPRVTCEAQNCSSGSCRFSLRCSAAGAGLGNVSYLWSVGNLPRGVGQVLLVEKSPRDEEEPLTCTAQNPVSSRNVSVPTAGGLCAGESQGRGK